MSGNKLDEGFNEITVCYMILYMLPRKQEHFYNTIDETNITNIAEHLIKCIPSGSFAELKSKADLNDPVRF